MDEIIFQKYFFCYRARVTNRHMSEWDQMTHIFKKKTNVMWSNHVEYFRQLKSSWLGRQITVIDFWIIQEKL